MIPSPQDENKAATVVQASFKGHMGRKQVKAMKEEKAAAAAAAKAEAERILREDEAAIYVQKVQRGRQARKEVAARRAAAA